MEGDGTEGLSGQPSLGDSVVAPQAPAGAVVQEEAPTPIPIDICRWTSELGATYRRGRFWDVGARWSRELVLSAERFRGCHPGHPLSMRRPGHPPGPRKQLVTTGPRVSEFRTP